MDYEIKKQNESLNELIKINEFIFFIVFKDYLIKEIENMFRVAIPLKLGGKINKSIKCFSSIQNVYSYRSKISVSDTCC